MFELSQYRLALPVNSAGELTGTAYYVDPTSPPAFAAPYFIDNPNYVDIRCPKYGASTASVDRARCELQGKAENEFSIFEGKTVTREFELYDLDGVIAFPMNEKLVIAQFHAGEFPMTKINLTRRSYGWEVRAMVKHESVAGSPDTPYALGAIEHNTRNTLVMQYSPAPNQRLTFVLNGGTPVIVPITYTDPSLTGIAPTFGAYRQSTEGDDSWASIRFFR